MLTKSFDTERKKKDSNRVHERFGRGSVEVQERFGRGSVLRETSVLKKCFDAERKRKKELKKGDQNMEKRSLELPEPCRFVRGVNKHHRPDLT